MVDTELVLLECPTSTFYFKDLDENFQMKNMGTKLMATKAPFISGELIDFEHWARLTNPEQNTQWGKEKDTKLPTIYRIFIDRIEFDLKALEAYNEIMSNSIPNTAEYDRQMKHKAELENCELPEILFLKDINNIELHLIKVKRGWTTGTLTDINCYEIRFKDDKTITIPLEIGHRTLLECVQICYPNLPKLHLWWKELVEGKIPRGLDLYRSTKFNEIEKAKKHEKLLEFNKAADIYKKLKMDEDVIRVRNMKADLAAPKTEIHGDYIDDRDTIVKDSVINRSNIGTGGKSKAEEIKEIKDLLDSGAIDGDEFKQMKKEILGK
jgi:hypothetical protein